VDFFVLVESTHSFVGKEKPLFYQENKHLFEKFNHKIIHIIVDDFPHKYPNIDFEKNEQWNNEKFQRNCISQGIDKLSLQSNDVITITDLDEIPNPKILEQIKNNDVIVDINIIELDFYYYNLNSKMDHLWHHSKILTFQKYNELNITCDKIRFYSCPIIKNAGWHLSYFGDENFIKNKIENFSHQEYNKVEFIDEKLIEKRINDGKDLFDRPTSIIKIPIEENDNLPPKYSKYLTNYYKKSMFNENWYPDEQITNLISLLNKTTNLSGRIIEIGCWEGKSTSYLARNCFPEILICNDTWQGNTEESKVCGVTHITELILKERDVYNIFIENMNNITNRNYEIVKEDCLVWLSNYKEPIKFIHIDASHEYESVFKTIKLILPNLIKGGIICGDDFLNAPASSKDLNGGVERAVRESLPKFNNIGNFWYFINE